MTRVGTPENERVLLNLIGSTARRSHAEHVVRSYRRALDSRGAFAGSDSAAGPIALWYPPSPDGSLVIRARVPAEIGALFMKALQAAEDSLPIPENVPAGTSSDFEEQHRSRKRRVEALATLAESFLAIGPRDLSGSDRQQIVVHVDVETLKHRDAGRCELNRAPPSPRRPHGALPATAAWCGSSKTPKASCWMSAERAAPSRRHPPGSAIPGPGLPVPRLYVQALRGWSSRQALGQWW